MAVNIVDTAYAKRNFSKIYRYLKAEDVGDERLENQFPRIHIYDFWILINCITGSVILTAIGKADTCLVPILK